MPSGVSLDTSRIAVSEESGGGYAARIAGILAEPKPTAVLLQYAMGGQLLDDHWLAIKDRPLVPQIPDISAEAFKELLTQPQEPISYDPMPMLGDDAPNGDSRRCMFLLLWWETGELLDHILRSELSTSLCNRPFEERADALPAGLPFAVPQTQMTSSFSPTFLYHGKDDELVLPAESELTHQQLRSLGVDVKLHVLDGAVHAMMDVKNPTALAPGAQEIREEAMQFLLGKLL